MAQKKRTKKSKNQKNKKETSKLEQELKNIYQDKKGKLPDLSRLEHKSKSRFSRIIIYATIILLVLSAVSWAGFFVFQSQPAFRGDQVNLKISAPFNITSGEKVNYQITITNKENVALEKSKLNLRLPNGYILQTSNLPFQKEDTELNGITNIYNWQLNKINPGEVIEVDIQGQLIGEVGTRPAISATLKYYPENYSSTFEKSDTFTSEIVDTNLKLTAAYNPQVASEEPTSINLTIKNLNQDLNLKDLKLEFDLPEEFINPQLLADQNNPDFIEGPTEQLSSNLSNNESEESSSKNDSTTNQLENQDFVDLDNFNANTFDKDQEIFIPGLNPQNSLNYQLTGNFEVEKTQTKQINIRVFIKDAQGDYILQTEETLEFQVIKGELLTELLINGKDTASSLNFGQEVSFLLKIKNKSKSTLGDLKIRAVLNSPAIDWDTLNDPQNGTLSNNQLLWTKEEIPDLQLLLPEGEVKIPFSIKLLPYQKASQFNQEQLRLTTFYEVEINQIDTLETHKIIGSPTLISEFNSNTQLLSQARYFDEQGNALGSGPLPPQVGQKTTFDILWKIDNSFNELEQIEVSSQLPSNVNWEFQVNAQAGNLRLDGDKVIWTINRMPKSIKTLTANFKVSITPQEEDRNKILTLLKKTTLTAIDKKTLGEIILTSPPLTTNIETNSPNQGLVE